MRILKFIIYSIILAVYFISFAANAADTEIGHDSARKEISSLIEKAYDLNIEWHADSALTLCMPLAERARIELGESDSTYARALEVLATCYYYLGEYDRCEELFQEVLHIREDIFEPGDFRIVDVIFRLGQTYSRQFSFDLAEKYLNRASALWERYFGRNSKKYGTTQGELGWVYLENGDFFNAEKYLKLWAEISRKVVGENHANYASASLNLGLLYRRFGYLDKADDYYKQSLRIFENIYGPVHPVVAKCFSGLGIVQTELENYDEAEAYNYRALEIRREFFKDNHPEVANSYWNLAEIKAFKGEYAVAESLFHKAIDIQIENYGPEAYDACQPMRMLGIMLGNHGRYDEGIAWIKRSIEIAEKVRIRYHYNMPSYYFNLALIYGYKGDFETARYYFEKQLSSRREFLESIFPGASSERKLHYIREYRNMENSLYSMAIIDSSLESRKLALDMILHGKSFVLDAVAAEKQIAYCTDNADVVKASEELTKIYTDIANLTIAANNSDEERYLTSRLGELYDVKDSLESKLSSLCSDFADDLSRKDFSVEDIVQAVPEHAVLLEFVRYLPYDFGPTGSAAERKGNPRYLAFTLDHAGDIDLVDLADAQIVDSLIDCALTEIENAPVKIYSGKEKKAESRLTAVTSRLYDLLLAPLESDFTDKYQILISPDSRLSLLPFEVLSCPDGSYAIEKYRISYLSSGRDLLKFKGEIDRERSQALVIADPDYDMFVIGNSTANPGLTFGITDAESYLPVRNSDCLAERFSPLPSTFTEGNKIARQLEVGAGLKVDFLYRDGASEETLKNLSEQYSIIHISTHGYFCPGWNKEGVPQNPLVYSGLALAGSNQTIDERYSGTANVEDGILTSLEVSSLDLVGTDLVVLSACLTGAGETVDGEGVFGLRRAFQLAGARSILMSMWSVPDKETKELMQGFYESWLAGSTKSEAIRNSALNIISKRRNTKDSTHPLFWGGFILLGDPN